MCFHTECEKFDCCHFMVPEVKTCTVTKTAHFTKGCNMMVFHGQHVNMSVREK